MEVAAVQGCIDIAKLMIENGANNFEETRSKALEFGQAKYS